MKTMMMKVVHMWVEPHQQLRQLSGALQVFVQGGSAKLDVEHQCRQRLRPFLGDDGT